MISFIMLIIIIASLIIGGVLLFENNFAFLGVVACFLGMGFILMYSDIIKKESYKQGQIDALTGKVKYELKIQVDSTKTWEVKK